jgi:hypothetical protein
LAQNTFKLAMARLEKRSLLTFVSKIYQKEAMYLSDDLPETLKATQIDLYKEDFKLKESVALAVNDPDLSVDRAKELLKDLAAKVGELETRLTDYEDTSHQV